MKLWDVDLLNQTATHQENGLRLYFDPDPSMPGNVNVRALNPEKLGDVSQEEAAEMMRSGAYAFMNAAEEILEDELEPSL